jgi:hypothetical protein
MKKILYVILHTCTRPDRYEGIVNSWGKDVDFLFYSDCDNEEKKIVKVSDNTTYSSNEPKHVNVIKYLVENDYQYKWFFFCDDDTFVNTDKLEQNLDSFNKTQIHGSVLKGTWGTDPSLEYCSGGAGYLINYDVLNILGQHIKIKDTGYSDVTVGMFCKELNIELKNYDTFRSQNPKFYNLENDVIKDFFTFHYITSEDMLKLYNILK